MAIASLAPNLGMSFALGGPKEGNAIPKEKINNKEKITLVPKGTFEKTVHHDHFVHKVYDKISAYILDPNHASWINALVGEARAVYSLVKHFFETLSAAAKIFACTQLTHILSLPFDIHSLLMRFYSLAVDKGINPKIDALLGIGGDAISIGDGLTTYVIGLTEIGVFAQSTLVWALPVNIVCNLLSAIFFVINGRNLYFTAKVLKDLDEKLKKPQTPDYLGALDVLKKREYALEAHCSVKMEIVNDKINEVLNAYHSSKIPESEKEHKFDEQMQKMFSALKTKIKCRQASLGLSMATTKVGILATIFFSLTLLCKPLAPALIPVTCALLAVMFLIAMSKLSLNLSSDIIFKRKLRQIKPAF